MKQDFSEHYRWTDKLHIPKHVHVTYQQKSLNVKYVASITWVNHFCDSQNRDNVANMSLDILSLT